MLCLLVIEVGERIGFMVEDGVELRFFFLLGARDSLRGLESETVYKNCGMCSRF